jgi:hypothetical protein
MIFCESHALREKREKREKHQANRSTDEGGTQFRAAGCQGEVKSHLSVEKHGDQDKATITKYETSKIILCGHPFDSGCTAWYLADIGESRGKQDLFVRQAPQSSRTEQH